MAPFGRRQITRLGTKLDTARHGEAGHHLSAFFWQGDGDVDGASSDGFDAALYGLW